MMKRDEFDAAGEALGYISLDQAVLQARVLAQQDEERYLQRLGWNEIVWTETGSEQREDSYRVVLQFRRPARGLREEQTGEEEFVFSLTGNLEFRQVLAWPVDMETSGGPTPGTPAPRAEAPLLAVPAVPASRPGTITEFEMVGDFELAGRGRRVSAAIMDFAWWFVIEVFALAAAGRQQSPIPGMDHRISRILDIRGPQWMEPRKAGSWHKNRRNGRWQARLGEGYFERDSREIYWHDRARPRVLVGPVGLETSGLARQDRRYVRRKKALEEAMCRYW